ncbi:MAG: cell wall-binding repeat-containing protein [Herbiconiux sp.]|nr:cell wall-binding repeat-containing protein [Herbiconiux sp.]
MKRPFAVLLGAIVLVGVAVAPPAPTAQAAETEGFSIEVDVIPPEMPEGSDGSPPPLTTWLSVYTMRGAEIDPSDYGRLSDLTPGQYLVKVAAMAPYADAWYGDTPYRSRAQPVEITDHDVTVTVHLGWTGTVTGSVTAADGRPLENGLATAYLYDASDGSYEQAGVGTTDGAGAYSMSVPAGSYVVRGSEHDLTYPSGYSMPLHADRLFDYGRVVEVAEKEVTSGVVIGLTPWVSTTTERVAGGDRFSTAVEASQAAFEPGVPAVYITNGLHWPDALSAGPAASHDGGPLLLTEPNVIPAVLDSELHRLKPQRIVVVGGPNSVSDAVLARLGDYSSDVHRIGGANRYEVSRAVSLEVFGTWVPTRTMFVASGATFADALSAGAVAARAEAPVVLIDTSGYGIDDPTRFFLFGSYLVVLAAVGGPNSISDNIYDQLGHFTKWEGVSRYVGADRFAVNRGLNGGEYENGTYPWPEWQQTAYLVNGRNFPDALSATSLAAAEGARVYLTEQDCVPQQTLDLIRGSHIDHLVLVGGPASLGDGVARLQPC